MSVPIRKSQEPSTIEDVLMKGDLGGLSQTQRLEYYNQVCKSIGLNPLTRPFEYLVLNGKLQLYARRDAADQLRKINGISIKIVSQELTHGLLTIHVHASDKDGRTDEDLGVVNFPETLNGDVAANTILKAVTKAKRRVTLSICGLGFLDETETEDIPGARTTTELKLAADNPSASSAFDHAQQQMELISADQVDEIERLLEETKKSRSAFLDWVRISCPSVVDIDSIPVEYYWACIKKLDDMRPK